MHISGSLTDLVLSHSWIAGLKRNPEMVYALLHRQEVFEPFRMHVRFADILDNIQVLSW